MKSFKKYISEAEWASSYETNYIIKKALKKYDNPIGFLLNLMHYAKKLPIMGKKNTLELVKVWNDNKSKKINAALVEQVLSEERKLNLKGWMHLSGKSVLSNIRSGYKPYHMQMLTRNPREFGVKEKDLKKILRDEYDHPDLKALDKHWDELVEGIYDKEDVLAAYMHKKGWAEVVFEDGNNSIEMGDNPKPRDIQKIAYEIDKTYSDSQLFPESSAYFEVKLKGKRVDIDNILDFRSFIKTGKVPTRSEIGRTMAQFREEQESITEVFDKPYKWRIASGRVAVGDITLDNDGFEEYYVFKTSDGGTIEFIAHHWWYGTDARDRSLMGLDKIKKDGHLIAIEFVKRDAQFDYSTYDMTGEGDAIRIMATVLDIIKSIIKKHEPMTLVFSADKKDEKIVGNTGRAKAYGAMVRRFASRLGYKSEVKDSTKETKWQLTKK
jgi:hypothetical protein